MALFSVVRRMRDCLAADPSSVAALLGSPGVLIYPNVNSVRRSTQNHHHESASTARPISRCPLVGAPSGYSSDALTGEWASCRSGVEYANVRTHFRITLAGETSEPCPALAHLEPRAGLHLDPCDGRSPSLNVEKRARRARA